MGVHHSVPSNKKAVGPNVFTLENVLFAIFIFYFLIRLGGIPSRESLDYLDARIHSEYIQKIVKKFAHF